MGVASYKYTFRINASHRNVSPDADIHNHTFELALYLKPVFDRFEAYDITENIISDFLKPFAGVLLNTAPPFDTISPTIENIGKVFFTELAGILGAAGYKLTKLEISESPQRSFSVCDEDFTDEEKVRLSTYINKLIESQPSAESSRPGYAFRERAVNTQTEPAASVSSFTLRTHDDKAYDRLNKPSSLRSFLFSFALLIFAGFAVMQAVKASGIYPLGLDIHSHLFKADLMYHEILKGNFYPLYTEYWYNGVQPFRYWAPMSYYLMAFMQFLCGGNVMGAYLGFIWASFTIGGTGWLMFGKKLGRPFLGAFFGLTWFIFPDNLRVFFGEGNMPRMFITMLLPFILYVLWQFVCYRRKKMIIPLILLMILSIMGHLMISAMIGVAAAIYLLIYSIANKRFSESITAIFAMLFSFAAAGIWVYPSLLGGLTSMDSDATAAVMAAWSTKLAVSLNPIHRFTGDITELYWGLSLALIAAIGIFVSNKKSLPGFMTLLIIIAGSTTALTPLIQLIPLSQLFWVRRFAPIAYAMFTIAVIEWRNIKKPVLALLCAAILIDSVPSFLLSSYDVKMNMPATVLTMEQSMTDTLFSQAKEAARQRISLMDLSSLGPLPSYALCTLSPKTPYVFGWAWQGAVTASNIAYLNESLEKKNYLYMFDRNLELGADTVILDKVHIEDSDRKDLLTAAARVGYAVTAETKRTMMFSLPVESTFGLISQYSGLAIGTTAALVPGILPYYHPGDKQNIDEYTVDELKGYDKIYLSGFFYNDKAKAEKLVREIAESGVEIFIDMSRIPSDPLTNRMTFLDISAQPITLYNSYPDLITDTSTISAKDFYTGYENWNTVYLNGLSESDGYAWLEETRLNFVGTGETENITFLGFNLLFHAYTADDAAVKSILNAIMELDEDTLPSRTVVPVEISYEKNKIVIKSEHDNVNTTLAYQDIFESDQNIRSMNNFLIVDKGTTVITMEYPHLTGGIIISLAGICLEAVLVYLLFRKPGHTVTKNKKPQSISF